VKNPPILISIIGFFAALAGFGFLFFGLRVIGFDWFGALGDLPAFEHVGLWGWLAVATGLVWILAAVGLWALQPWARLFALIMAGIALFEAVLAFFQFPGTGVGFAMAIMPALILWYLNSSEIKAVFAEGEPATAAPATAAPATATREPVAAPVAVSAAAAEAAASKPVAAAQPVAVAVAADTAVPEPVEAPVAAHLMKIEDVEGIGPAYAEKLAAVGIGTTDDLLANGAWPYDREKIAETTGISSTLIRDWVDKVDLMRVPGVGPQYSDLLEAAGVGSPAELAQRNAANLAITVQEVVAARPGIVRRVPSEAEITAWIEEASKLEKVVEH
jgi:predicted flap endonuclease-1-like 5' DNA nuclease